MNSRNFNNCETQVGPLKSVPDAKARAFGQYARKDTHDN